MAKGKGATCPHCTLRTFHDKGSHRLCSKCGYIGWRMQQDVASVGKGSGNACPNCNKQTLHGIQKLKDDSLVRRCGTCGYTAIEPKAVVH